MADDRDEDPPDDGPPQYTVYKSRPRLLRREERIEDLREGVPRPDGEQPGRRRWLPGGPGPAGNPPRRRRWLPWRRRPGRRRLTFGRFVAWVLLAVILWVGVSFIL